MVGEMKAIDLSCEKTPNICSYTVPCLRFQVITSKQPKLGLTQELFFSRICESTTGYTFTPCVGSFTSPGIDT